MIHDAASIRWYKETLSAVHLLLGEDKRPLQKQTRSDALVYNRQALKSVLYAKRKKMGRASRGRVKNKPKWLYPWATERRYGAAIRAWLKPLEDYVHEYLKNNQEAILRGDSDTLIRQDEIPGGTYRRLVKSLTGWHTVYFPPVNESGTSDAPPQVIMGLGKIADSMNDFNSKQWDKAARAELGVEFPVYEDWWPNTKQAWQEENYALIQNMGSDYIKRINRATERAVTGGMSVGQLTQAIQKINKSMKASRANLIARDQIGKLNGQVTQARMEAVGLEMYEWSTCIDERVRESHAELEGKICRWDDFTVYSEDGKTWRDRPSDWCQLHPGQDIQCRCTALSYWAELVEEVDRDIDFEEGYIASGSDDEPETNKSIGGSEYTDEHGRKTPLIESQLDIEQGKPMSVDSSAAVANVNYGNAAGYNDNCQRSIVSYELQRRGYRVTAMPAPANREKDPVKIGLECFIGNSGKLKVERAVDKNDFLKAMGRYKNARFAISQTWEGRGSSYGHTYIAEVINGKLRIVDPQIGQPNAERLLDRVGYTSDGQYNLNFFRIDNAFLNPKIDFTGVVTPHPPKTKIDKMDSHDVSFKQDKKMTKEEARSILEKSGKLAPVTENGVTYNNLLGDFYKELSDAYGFVVYPYSSDSPVDPLWAFAFYVLKESEQIIASSSPIPEGELKALNKAP